MTLSASIHVYRSQQRVFLPDTDSDASHGKSPVLHEHTCETVENRFSGSTARKGALGHLQSLLAHIPMRLKALPGRKNLSFPFQIIGLRERGREINLLSTY